MFAYGLLEGLRLGYLQDEKCLTTALDGYDLMTETRAEVSGGWGIVLPMDCSDWKLELEWDF